MAEIIKLIIRDESVHGTYTGYKFQQGYNELSEPEQEEMKMWVYNPMLGTLPKRSEVYTIYL